MNTKLFLVATFCLTVLLAGCRDAGTDPHTQSVPWSWYSLGYLSDTVNIDALLQYSELVEMDTGGAFFVDAVGSGYFSVNNTLVDVGSAFINGTELLKYSTGTYMGDSISGSIDEIRVQVTSFAGHNIDASIQRAPRTLLVGESGFDTISISKGFSLTITNPSPDAEYRLEYSAGHTFAWYLADSTTPASFVPILKTNVGNTLSFNASELSAAQPYRAYVVTASAHRVVLDTLSNGRVIAYLSISRTELPLIFHP
jgi:hypothetical protein